MFEIERIAEDLSRVVVGLDPACFDGRDAARLTEVAAKIERFGATAKALLAKRAADTNAWRHGSRAASPEQWLAEASGCSEGSAREVLVTATRLGELPATAEEERVVAAATDEAEARRRAHAERHVRTWTNGVATRGSISGPTDQVAKLLHALEPLTRARFDEARRAGERASHDAYRFDALVTLADQGGSATARKREPTPCGYASTCRHSCEGVQRRARRVRSPASVPSPSPTPNRSSPTDSCSW